jgi:hypothetical protein
MFRCKIFYQIAENKNVDRRMTCVNRITVVYEKNYIELKRTAEKNSGQDRKYCSRTKRELIKKLLLMLFE